MTTQQEDVVVFRAKRNLTLDIGTIKEDTERGCFFPEKSSKLADDVQSNIYFIWFWLKNALFCACQLQSLDFTGKWSLQNLISNAIFQDRVI